MPSTECYDSNNFDIFSSVVSERLELVKEHYHSSIAKIIGNMVNYDFNERMSLR
jgi:hypothetical protein